MINKLHIFFCLISAVIATIISIINRAPLVEAFVNIIITIIISFIVGVCVKYYIQNRVFRDDKPEDELEKKDHEDHEELENSEKLKDEALKSE